MSLKFDEIQVGDLLPEHASAPISRHTLALYCGASGDHNPMHVDIDFARKFGMEDVFAHGMLSMAYLAQLLTKWAPQEQLRHWAVRFTSITPVHAKVICTGKVVEKFEEDGEKRVRLEIEARTDKAQQTLAFILADGDDLAVLHCHVADKPFRAPAIDDPPVADDQTCLRHCVLPCAICFAERYRGKPGNANSRRMESMRRQTEAL